MASVAQDVERGEQEEGKTLWDAIEQTQRGIPHVRTAVFRALEDLSEEEQLAFLVVVEVGQGSLAPTDEVIEDYFQYPAILPSHAPVHWADRLDLDEFIYAGLERLDERVQ